MPGEENPISFIVHIVNCLSTIIHTNLVLERMVSPKHTSKHEKVMSTGIMETTSAEGARGGVPINILTACINARALQIMSHPVSLSWAAQ